jgi:alkylated DNA repair dioxygenase AlkB
MYDLFNPIPDNSRSLIREQNLINSKHLENVPGLQYVPDFLSIEEEKELLRSINDAPWLSDIKRRVQHYGYKYDYKARSIDYSMYLGPLPEWAADLGERLFRRNFIDKIPDQLIINEYLPGQGIANHVDCEPCFGETIISISLCSPCVMDFISLRTKEKLELILEPRSLVVVSGEARHKWTHGIAFRKSDYFCGVKYDRSLRISMTFRYVTINN